MSSLGRRRYFRSAFDNTRDPVPQGMFSLALSPDPFDSGLGRCLVRSLRHPANSVLNIIVNGRALPIGFETTPWSRGL